MSKQQIKLHICETCDRKCDSAFKLIEHERIHTNEKPFKCEIVGCSYATPKNSNLKSHIRNVHTNEKPFKCDLCDYAAKEKHKLTLHYLIHTDERKYKCQFPGCCYTAKQNSHLTVHQRTHTGEKPHTCPECNFSCSVGSSLKTHIEMQHLHTKRFKCAQCPYSSYQKSKLIQHERKHTKEKPYQCDHPNCDHRSATTSQMNNHRQTHLDRENKEYKCRECGNKFLLIHYLRAHIRRVHLKLNQNRVECSFMSCTKRFHNRLEMEKHFLRIHKGDKPFKCQVNGCEYRSVLKGDLTAHERIHSDDRPFKCDFEGCDYAARAKDRLKDHKRTHSQERPYRCQLCPYDSVSRGGLWHHTRLHKSKSFTCSQCQFVFVSSWALKKHQKTHKICAEVQPQVQRGEMSSRQLRNKSRNSMDSFKEYVENGRKKHVGLSSPLTCMKNNCGFMTKNLVELAQHYYVHGLPLIVIEKC